MTKRFCKTYIKTIPKYQRNIQPHGVIYLTARIISTFIFISTFPKQLSFHVSSIISLHVTSTFGYWLLLINYVWKEVKLWGCGVARLWGCEVVKLWGCEVVSLRGFQAVRLTGCEFALWGCDVWSSEVRRLWGWEVVWLWDYETMRLWDYDMRLWDYDMILLRLWGFESLRGGFIFSYSIFYLPIL